MLKNFKANPLGLIILYFISMLIGVLVGMVLFGFIGASKFDLSLSKVLNIISYTEADLIKDGSLLVPLNEYNCYYFMQTWLNFSQYAVMALACGLFAIPYFKEDITVIKKDKKRFLIMLGVAIVAVAFMLGASALIGLLVDKLSTDTISSQNQNLIVGMINHGNKFVVFITIFFLAPVVEELVYRKSIFKLLKNYKPWLSILVSALLFALPHMLSTEESFIIWLLLFLNYLLSGLTIALVYKYSNNNIYISIACHMLNNLVSFLLIVL